MRARNLKPEFFRDRKMGVMGPTTALVFQALWCLADDFGTVPCDPEQVKGEMFVYWPDVGVPEIAGALRHLCGTGRVTLFMVGDQLFARILNWKKHQKPHKPSAFKHPTTGQEVAWDGDVPVPHSTGTSEALPTSLEPRAYSQSYNNNSGEPFSWTEGELAFFAAVPPEKRGYWEAVCRNWRNGLGTPGMKAFSPDDISIGLLEYLAKTDKPDFTPQYVVAFPDGIRARREEGRVVRPPRSDGALSLTEALLRKPGANAS